jgi:hypothetical protein
MELDIKESLPQEEDTLTQAEHDQVEAGYQEYALLRIAYEHVIGLETCPTRARVLTELLNFVNEDNQ